ncbi:hypothetical protein LPJ66_002976 [Kickxella alabastrina]|uniref:Uncharacterized protein n=1 Tax=Kickxella alabastrina TaxID=61397 RepID=A0ACC1IMY7_9FUNG|nr:hypothetical protein LPJ66_002976 [Kickxella alabastrina]
MSSPAYPYEENIYTLYSNANCPFAQRALRAFYIAQVPHKVVEIDLTNKPDWYHLVNPQLKVPALRTPSGTILIESLILSEFAADQFPDSHLLPSDATERAQLRLFVEIFSSRIIPNIFGSLRGTNAKEIEEKKAALLAGFKELNDELVKQWARIGGDGALWLGDKVSLAEVNTVSFYNLLVAVEHYRGFAVPDTDEFAAFHKWVAAFTKLPAYTEFKVDDDQAINKMKKFVPEAN